MKQSTENGRGPVHVSAGRVPSSIANQIGGQPLFASSSFQVYLARSRGPSASENRGSVNQAAARPAPRALGSPVPLTRTRQRVRLSRLP